MAKAALQVVKSLSFYFDVEISHDNVGRYKDDNDDNDDEDDGDHDDDDDDDDDGDNDDDFDRQEKISISAGGALAFDTVNLLINTFSSLVRWPIGTMRTMTIVTMISATSFNFQQP